MHLRVRVGRAVKDPLAEPSRIAFAGDWHENASWAASAIAYAKDHGADVIVHLGDLSARGLLGRFCDSNGNDRRDATASMSYVGRLASYGGIVDDVGKFCAYVSCIHLAPRLGHATKVTLCTLAYMKYDKPSPLCKKGCGNVVRCSGYCQRCYAKARYSGEYTSKPRQDPLPRFEPDREELAWAAGFIDGEGSFLSHVGRLPVLQVPQSGDDAPRILGRVREALGLGGSITSCKPRKPHHKTAYRLTVTGFERVQAAVARLWPWLTPPKRRQAVAMLVSFHDYYMPPGQRRRLNNARRRLQAGEVPLFDSASIGECDA